MQKVKLYKSTEYRKKQGDKKVTTEDNLSIKNNVVKLREQ